MLKKFPSEQKVAANRRNALRCEEAGLQRAHTRALRCQEAGLQRAYTRALQYLRASQARRTPC